MENKIQITNLTINADPSLVDMSHVEALQRQERRQEHIDTAMELGSRVLGSVGLYGATVAGRLGRAMLDAPGFLWRDATNRR